MKVTPKFARTRSGISVNDMAELLGIHRSTLARKEAGKARWFADEAEAFADACGMSVADIAFGKK